MNVLFVCSGNTCRSPMAKALIKALAKEKGLDIAADSAGLFAFAGAPASDGAIRVMKDDYGLDLSAHRAKALDGALIKWADKVICMTGAQQELAKADFPDATVCTLGAWAGQNFDIRDPHGGRTEEYRICAQQIKKLIEEAAGRDFEWLLHEPCQIQRL